MFNKLTSYFSNSASEKVFKIQVADPYASLTEALTKYERQIAKSGVKAIVEGIRRSKQRVVIAQTIIGGKAFDMVLTPKEFKECLNTYIKILAKYDDFEDCIVAKNHLDLLSF